MDAVTLVAAKAATLRAASPRFAAALRPIALRSNHLGNSTYLSASNNTSATYRVQHHLIPGVRAHGIRLLFGANAGSFGSASSLTVSAAVEFAGSTYSVTFRGSYTVTVNSTTFVLSDPLPLVIDPDELTDIYTRTYVSSTGQWPIGLSLNSVNGEGSSIGNPGTDLTGNGQNQTPTNPSLVSNVGCYSPVAILGHVNPKTTPAVLIVGDSISIGTGDGGSHYGGSDTLADYGLFMRAFNRTIPYLWCAKYGETLQTLISSRRFRQAPFDYATHMVCEYGVNDVPNSRTTAQMAGDLLTVWKLGWIRGLPVYQTTITPRTSTSDNWATTANQTIGTNDSARTGLNDWLRAGAPVNSSTLAYVALSGGVAPGGSLLAGQAGHPLTGYFEVADAVESARNSGKWKAANRTVADGAITTGTNTFTSATAAFTSADLYRTIAVAGAGGAGALLTTTISSVTNGTTVTLQNNASTTVSGAATVIDPYTVDGVHPGVSGHIAAAAAIDTTKFKVAS